MSSTSCRDCNRLTSGDCGMHGPRIIPTSRVVVTPSPGEERQMSEACWGNHCTPEECVLRRLREVEGERDAALTAFADERERRMAAETKARREERQMFNAFLDEWEAAYPEDVFKPFTAADHPHVSPDRIAAEMGRHMARELRKQIAGQPASAPKGETT